jgi:hypothetical protein
MNFEIDGKISYDIPLKNVSNTNMSKNEVILQFHQNDQASVSLMEIRYHIPSNNENENDSAQVNEAYSTQFKIFHLTVNFVYKHRTFTRRS